MIATTGQNALEARIATLEGRLERLELSSTQTLQSSGPPPARAGSVSTPHRQARDHIVPSAACAPSTLHRGMSFGDVVGGRVLAWLGGAATLLGIVLFLALAISRGWIGEEARTLLAAATSAALMAVGAWLHDHRGRTDAAVVMVATATAGLLTTLIVASDVYRLLPDALAVVGAMLGGALAIGLASRWTGHAGWLALGTVLMCAPQWAPWVLSGQPALLDVFVLAGFAALGLIGAVGVQMRCTEDRLVPSSAAVLALSACIVAVVGRVALAGAAGAPTGDLWLAVLACVHVGLGVWGSRRVRISQPLRGLLIAIGVTLGDVAFGFSAHGVALAAGWSATAVAFAWLARRSAPENSGETLMGLGISTQIALALIAVLIQAPPSNLGGGHVQLLGLLSVSALAASCIACGRLSAAERRSWRIDLDSLGLVAIAYLTASALGGAALAVAWALEGLALTRLSSRTDDAVTRFGALAFVGAAALHVLVFEAPPVALTTGVTDLAAAALSLGALATVGLRMGLTQPAGSARRYWPLIGAGACLLYLASVAIVTAFQPTSTTVSDMVLDLSVRQQGQVALSALWSIVGLAGLIAGLRANIAQLRTAGLALLLVTVGKVFLYDLSTLTSVYRVVSFIVLGLLLLAGAFAYQRLRPSALPDLRTLHSSQR